MKGKCPRKCTRLIVRTLTKMLIATVSYWRYLWRCGIWERGPNGRNTGVNYAPAKVNFSSRHLQRFSHHIFDISHGPCLEPKKQSSLKYPSARFFAAYEERCRAPKGGKNADCSTQETQEIVKVTMDDKRIVKCDQRVNLDEDVDEAVTYGDSAKFCKFDGRGKGCYGWVILGGAVFRVSIFFLRALQSGETHRKTHRESSYDFLYLIATYSGVYILLSPYRKSDGRERRRYSYWFFSEITEALASGSGGGNLE